MRFALISLAAALPLAACASGGTQMVENGVPRGSLAVAALERGDFARAEKLLLTSTLPSDDPARLINLGHVYMEQGRRAEALAAWRAALASPRHRVVETMAGSEVRTDALARAALARHQASFASNR
jgi:tetratricopeptide (TPR) repeat protein